MQLPTICPAHLTRSTRICTATQPDECHCVRHRFSGLYDCRCTISHCVPHARTRLSVLAVFLLLAGRGNSRRREGAAMSSLDLGVIGNCVIAALISRAARIEWCCFPRLDGDPVFCSLMRGAKAEDGGFYDVAPEGAVPVSQRYRANTAVLETVLADRDGGSMRIVDFAPRFKLLCRNLSA